MSSTLNRRDFVIGGVLTGTALLCAGVAPGRS